MADTLEDIIIEIESDSSAAVSQLDVLSERLQNLKKAAGNSSTLATFSKNLEALNRSVSFLNTLDPSKAETIQKLATSAASFKGISISKSIGEQISKINEVISSVSPEAQSKLSGFVNAVMPLTQLNGFRYPQGLNSGLANTAKLAEQIKNADFSKLRELVSVITQLRQLSTVNASSVNQLSAAVKNYSTAAKSATTRTHSFNTALANVRTKTLGLVIAFRRVASGMTKSMSVYGDYVESLNLFKMALGSAATAEYEFAEKAQELLGIDLTQWMKSQGVFNALASGFGVASDKAALMSRNLTQLAYDISSFYNISVEDAIEKVQSGFAGQIRPVRNLGYDLSQTRLEAIALANGIDKNVQSMSQAEKSQLRYIALMTQLTEVQGDLSRTLDSPINQMRLLNAQLDQMMRSIGMVILPFLNKMIPYLNAILRVIKMIADEIAAMFGYTLPKLSGSDWSTNVSMGADELEEDLEDANGAAEKLKNTLASFDQINLITSSSGGSGSGSNKNIGGVDLGIDLPSYDFLGGIDENKAQEIANKMMKAIRPFVDMLKDAIKWTVDHLDLIKEVLEIIAVVTIGKKLYDKVMAAKEWFTGLSDTVAGIGLLTIGFQASWLGGKDLAQGNLVEGLLKSALGIASAGWGGLKMAGPLGAVLGVSLGIAFTVTGYFDEKTRQTEKEIRDRFYAIRESAKPLDEVAESWNHFLEQFANPSVMESFGKTDKLKEVVNTVGMSMAQLQFQYAAGSMTTLQYADSLESMYGKMEESIAGHIKGVGDALIESLHGPLGLWYEANGVNIQELEKMIGMTTDRIIEKLESNEMKLQELNHAYREGKMPAAEYEQAVKDLLGPLEIYYDRLGLSSEATNQFIESFKDVDINFENLDATIETLGQIKTGYEDTAAALDKEKNKIIDGWKALIPDATEEEKKQYEKAIELTESFYDTQKALLDANYRELLESFERQGTINWREAYAMEDYDVVQKTLYDDMKELDDMFSDMYGSAKMDRNETYWKQLIGLMDEYEKVAWGEGQAGELYEEFDRKFAKFNEDFVNSMKDRNNITAHMTENEKLLWNGLPPIYKKNGDAFKSYVNDGSYYASLYEKNMSSTASAVKVHMGDATEYMTDEMGEMVVVADRKVKLIGDIISDPSWSSDSMEYAMFATAQVMGSPDVLSGFMGGADKVMNSVATSITGNKDYIQRAYLGALETPTKPIVELGVGLGKALGDGIASTASYIEESTKEGTKGAARELNKFGEGFAEFMRGISSSTISGFDAFFQVTGANTISYNPASIKTPKVKGYASGGFPKTADFFYANENGVPEYVGTMGGRAAVANNQEITKGVADGVYKAIKETGLVGEVKKIAAKNGNVVFAPSEEAGRVMQQSVNLYNGTGGRY